MPTAVAAESIVSARLSVPLLPAAVAGLSHRAVAERVAAARVAAARVAAEQVVVAQSNYQSQVEMQPHFPQPARTPLPPSASSSMPSQRTCPCPDHEDAVD
jgi:hypothetical protein